MAMRGYKYFAKNIGVLTIGNFGTKLLNFFLIPLYTYLLTTEEYGTYDLFNTTVILLVPFLTLNVCESVLRFSMEDNVEHKGIISIGFRIFLKGFVLLFLFVTVNYLFGWISILRDYAIVFLTMYALNAISGIMMSFARGMDRIVDISVSGVLCTIVILVSNLILLLIFRWGIWGYFAAAILGNLAQNIYLFIRTAIWKYIYFGYKNTRLTKEMLSYSSPLIANSVAWWINNASDRYVVTWLCGMSENGIYSVGYKIPSVLNMFQNIFNQAWVLSAVRDFDSEDKNGFFSKMYNLYNCMMVLICSILILLDQPLAKLLYAEDFYKAWRYVPLLTISVVFGSMSGYIGGIFSATKNSKIFAQSTTAGAMTNIGFNFLLVYRFGAMGAAVATVISSILIWIIRLIHLKRCVNIKLHILRDVISYCLLFVQTIFLLTLEHTGYLYMVELFGIVVIFLLYSKEIISVIFLSYRKVRVTIHGRIR